MKEQQHADIVFEAAPDRPRPRLPRVADGVKFLNLDDAAAKYGIPRQTLLQEWLATFSSLDLTQEEPQPEPAPAVGEDPSPEALNVLRSRFPKLDDLDFNEVVAFARVRGFDPFIELRAERRDGRLIIRPTIQGLRARADRSGAYAGADEIEFEYDDDADRRDYAVPPVAATATVYKIVGPHKGRFRARVRWCEFFRDAREHADLKPEVALGRCAEAAALSKAFPRELGIR